MRLITYRGKGFSLQHSLPAPAETKEALALLSWSRCVAAFASSLFLQILLYSKAQSYSHYRVLLMTGSENKTILSFFWFLLPLFKCLSTSVQISFHFCSEATSFRVSVLNLDYTSFHTSPSASPISFTLFSSPQGFDWSSLIFFS